MTDAKATFPYHKALLTVVGLLTTIGLIAIYAASSLKGAQQFGDEFLFFRKQAVAAFLGFSAVFALQFVPFRWIERATLPVLGFALFLLGLIFVPGMYSKVGGASRWLNLPFIGGQPAELAKLAVVLFLAKNLSRPQSDMANFQRGILPNVLVFLAVTGLLLVQKDLGTPVLLFIVTFFMLIAAGVSRKFIFGAVASGVGAVIVAVIFEPYRIKRITSFLDPWGNVKGSGFQIIQSFVAFQNGGLFGAGLGESKQKLFFLPEAHTDFILAVIGEELGLVGVAVICLSFMALCWIGFRIAEQQKLPYRRFLAFGLTLLIAMQSVINMAVAMGLLPTKGMPLPYVSSGNSSLLVFLLVSAILARLGRDAAGEQPHAGKP